MYMYILYTYVYDSLPWVNENFTDVAQMDVQHYLTTILFTKLSNISRPLS